MNTLRQSTENSTSGTFNRLRQTIHGRLGKWALGGMLAAGAAIGITETVQVTHQNNEAQFEVTQKQIAPVIKATMVDIDKQTLAQQYAHPDDILTIDNPNGRADTVEFMNTAGVGTIIMGKTQGKADPEKPLYISYRNNTGTGEGTNGVKFVLTSPEGNFWVDQAYSQGASDFGGSTDGGWGAAASGFYEDTTDRGYGGNSMPAPYDAAQGIAAQTQEFKPFDTYTF